MSTDRNVVKRKVIITTFTLGFPGYYLMKNRNEIYKGTQILKEFYLKELIARSFLGLVVGFGIATYFYGAGPISKK